MYSERRGFPGFQINIPIDQVISRDKEATAKKIKHLEGNQVFVSQQQQLYLNALGDKHAMEEKNRDDNFRFMEENYERIYEAETKEFEQRFNDAGKDRHIETFAEKLGPTLLELAPTLLQVVDGIQQEKAKAKTEFSQNWAIDNKLTTKQNRLIADNVDLLKSKSDAAHKFFEEHLKTPGGIKDLDSVIEFIANDGHNNIEAKRIGANNSRVAIATNLANGYFISEEYKFQFNGQELDGLNIYEQSNEVYNAWVDSVVHQIPTEYKNAALNKENSEWVADFRVQIAGERGRYQQKKVKRQLEQRFFTGIENIQNGENPGKGLALFYYEQSTALNGSFDLDRRAETNERFQKLIDNDLISHEELNEMVNAEIDIPGKGKMSFMDHQGKQQRMFFNNLLQKAKQNGISNYNTAEGYQELRQNEIFDELLKKYTGSAERKQLLAATPTVKLMQFKSQIGLKNLNSLLSLRNATQIVDEPKTFYQLPVGKAIKPNVNEMVEDALKKIDLDLKKTNPKQWELSTKDGTKLSNYKPALGFAKLKVEQFLHGYVKNHPGVENDGIELIKAAEEYVNSTLMPQMTPTPPSADGLLGTPDEDRYFNLGLPGGDKTKDGGLGVVRNILYSPQNADKSKQEIVATNKLFNSIEERVSLQHIAGIMKEINQRPLDPNQDLSFITRNKHLQEIARMSGVPIVHAANLQAALYGYEPLREELTLSLEEYDQQSTSIQRLYDNHPELGLRVIRNQQEGLYDKPGAVPQSADYGGVDFSTNNISSIQKETAGGQSGVDVYFEDGRFPAFANGVVKEIGRQINPDGSGYGNYIVVASNDDETGEPIDVLYSHLKDNSILVKENQQVSLGQQLGTQGGTGSVYSQDGTIASIDVLASAPKGSGSMKPAKNWNRIVDNWINRMKNGTMHIGWQ